MIGGFLTSIVGVERDVQALPLGELLEAGFAYIRAAQSQCGYAPFAQREKINWTFDEAHTAPIPNGKVPARAVLPAAIIMGLLSEVLKYAYILALPWLNFQEVYGPFALSVSMMFWAFLSGLLLLTGAHLSAQKIFLKQE